jgi:hypothetical protein
LSVVGYRPHLVAAEQHPPSDFPRWAQPYCKGGNEVAHSILPCLGVFVLALDTTFLIPLPVVRESTGKQMNQAAAPLVRIMAGYESDRRGQSLSLSISQTDIPREHHPPVPHACVRACELFSHPLISTRSVFPARLLHRFRTRRSSERLVTVYGNTPAKDSAMRLDTGSVRPARAKTSNS